MSTPIALQLYSVREAAEKDFEATVRRVAALGYEGVEPAGFPGTTAAQAGKLFRELGLKTPSAHVAMPRGDALKEVLDILAATDCRRAVAGLGPNDFKSLDDIKRSCDVFNEAAQQTAPYGISFGVHNHWWEYTPVDGVYPYQVMLERCDPSITFEVDTYWVATAGVDPVEVVKTMGERAPLLHIKDGPANKEEPMTAVGDGTLNFPAILQAGRGHTEWLIVELDRCAGDMFEAVARSVKYLKTIR